MQPRVAGGHLPGYLGGGGVVGLFCEISIAIAVRNASTIAMVLLSLLPRHWDVV